MQFTTPSNSSPRFGMVNIGASDVELACHIEELGDMAAQVTIRPMAHHARPGPPFAFNVRAIWHAPRDTECERRLADALLAPEFNDAYEDSELEERSDDD